ncbi:MAG: hypothetical protein ACKE8G_05535 [Methylophagaceae bacterium]
MNEENKKAPKDSVARIIDILIWAVILGGAFVIFKGLSAGLSIAFSI